MNHKHIFQQSLLSLAAGLVLAGTTSLSLAQVSLPLTYTFDNNAPSWQNLWWGSGSSVYWDGSRDAATNIHSGSVRCEAPLNGDWGGCWGCVDNGWAWDQNIVIDNSDGKAGLLSCDILIDPSTLPTTSGDYGTFNFGLEDNVTWNLTSIGSATLPLSAATNWTHVAIPITAGAPAHFFGYAISVWPNNFTSSIKFNVDNLVLGPPVRIELINPVRLANGDFQFSVSNLTVGNNYSVMSSTNLADWSEEFYFSPSLTSYDYSDSLAPNAPQKFYRIKAQP